MPTMFKNKTYSYELKDTLESFHSVLSETKTVTVFSFGLISAKLRNVKVGITSAGFSGKVEGNPLI